MQLGTKQTHAHKHKFVSVGIVIHDYNILKAEVQDLQALYILHPVYFNEILKHFFPRLEFSYIFRQ